MNYARNRQTIVRLYLETNMSGQAIARKLKIHPDTVRRNLRKAGIGTKQPLPAHLRFLDKILFRVPPTDCWLWQAGRDKRGCGKFKDGKDHYAHRYAYELLVGPLDPSLDLIQTCGNRCCVNPSHLAPRTRGRRKTDAA